MDFYEKYKKFLIKQCSQFNKPFEEDTQKAGLAPERGLNALALEALKDDGR